MRARGLVPIAVVASASVGAASAATVRLSDHFSAADIERSAAYWSARYPLLFAGIVVPLVTLAALGVVASPALGRWATRVRRARWWATAAALAVVVTVVPTLASVPLAVGRHRLNRRYGLATNSLAEALGDVGRALGFRTVIAVVVAIVFVGLARALPRRWPFAAAGAGVVLVVVSVFLGPLVYEPAFNRFTPAPPPVAERVRAIARTLDVEVGDVVVADASRRTSALNAYVSGLGASRRVVLYDTLLARAPAEQIDFIVAHELAHVKHRDVAKGTALGAGGVVVGVAVLWWMLSAPGVRRAAGVDGAADPRAVPLLALFVAVASVVSLPVANAFSRSIEAHADRTAIRATGDPQAAIAVEVALSRSNISDLRPHPFVRWLLFTHPPAIERIRIVVEEGARAAGGADATGARASDSIAPVP